MLLRCNNYVGVFVIDIAKKAYFLLRNPHTFPVLSLLYSVTIIQKEDKSESNLNSFRFTNVWKEN